MNKTQNTTVDEHHPKLLSFLLAYHAHSIGRRQPSCQTQISTLRTAPLSRQCDTMTLAAMITNLIQAIEGLVAVCNDAFEAWSLMLTHMAATVAGTTESAGASWVAASDTSLDLTLSGIGRKG